jgi:hypothetical protein
MVCGISGLDRRAERACMASKIDVEAHAACKVVQSFNRK